jgi:hypothetical protein
MSTSRVLLELLNNYNFSDLENYPNVGINRKNEIEEFSYSGNFFIRNRNARLLITPQAQKEIYKCSTDFFYFAQKYVKIETIKHGVIPFKLRDWQKETVNAILEHRRLVLNVARQSGKSTIIVAFILWLAIFNGEKKYGIVANNSELTGQLMAMLKDMYMLLPPFLQHNVLKWNMRSIELSNKAKIVSAIASPSALRGQTISFLLCLTGETVVNIKKDGVVQQITMQALYNEMSV